MIAIIDYGMGNLRSVEKGLERVGVMAIIAGRPEQIKEAEGVVLPGVGAFGKAMQNLQRTGLDQAVLDAIQAGKPFLGICLGQQLLFEEGEEFGLTKGLGVVPGRVVRFEGPAFVGREALKIPHMGWNELRPVNSCPLFRALPEGAMGYFVHSFYGQPTDPSWTAAETDYGIIFASALWKENIFACQFHPEKSGGVGMQILSNFVKIVGGRAS